MLCRLVGENEIRGIDKNVEMCHRKIGVILRILHESPVIGYLKTEEVSKVFFPKWRKGSHSIQSVEGVNFG